ncbi:peptide ABC transporter substrate-binding protein [Xinfangfangia sp. CPCC 101601]|uniref:Peptide ABC transporter substrate-binding protein n=1 Tax=Pseudogemmobacter lacusdianii TaxID=3069608 RepID=A0ABU0VX69_9RHOB|nr:peptide ABC transporter substrate-binding protein [Xinfangfangia sp. CPCC 101601]MDQ2066332.1 peptide ABC transporter substrate-binding protein [Xinfangfangia sp. CPCC 101601]
MKMKGIGLLLASAALSFGLGGAAMADGVLDRGMGSEWSTLDPHVVFDGATGWILMDAYEGLINFGPGGTIVPGAAERWESSEDGLTHTFHLREGLKWSNGEPLVAQDFVNAVSRTLNPDTISEKGYYFYSTVSITGAAALANGETTDVSTLGVTAPDDRTVVITLDNPAPHLLYLMGAFQMSPVHSPSLEASGTAAFGDPTKVVTNGAYAIKEVVPQSHILLEKNPNYWDAANVSIEKVKYYVTEDVATELKRFQAGELDITYDIPVNQIEALKAEIPDQVMIAPSTYVSFYSFNLTKPEFQDINVRTALAWAINREVLQEKIVKGGATPSYAFAGGVDPEYNGPQMPGFELSQEEREAKAKELMAAAGFGPDNPLKINVVTTVAEDRMRIAQGVALMWKQVLGVETDIRGMERKAWLDEFYTTNWDVFSDGLIGDFAGAETFLSYMRPSAEPGYNWVSPEYDAAMDVAGTKADKASRDVELAKAEKILLDDMTLAPIAVEPMRALVSTKVNGWIPSATGYYNSQYLRLE